MNSELYDAYQNLLFQNIPDGSNKIPVLFNTHYGGTFQPSDEAFALYNKRKLELEPNWFPVDAACDIERTDFVMVQIFYELGSRFDGAEYSKTDVCMIPAEYKNYYSICDEFDSEPVSIDLDRYRLDETLKTLSNTYIVLDNVKYALERAKTILTGDLSNDNKVRELSAILL